MLAINLAIGSLTLQLAPQNFLKPQFMNIAIKLFVILIQRVIGQMYIRVIVTLCVVIFLSCQAYKAVIIEINVHRTYYGGY